MLTHLPSASVNEPEYMYPVSVVLGNWAVNEMVVLPPGAMGAKGERVMNVRKGVDDTSGRLMGREAELPPLEMVTSNCRRPPGGTVERIEGGIAERMTVAGVTWIRSVTEADTSACSGRIQFMHGPLHVIAV